MDTTETLVVVGAIALIALVLWYFFGEREKTSGTSESRGICPLTRLRRSNSRRRRLASSHSPAG